MIPAATITLLLLLQTQAAPAAPPTGASSTSTAAPKPAPAERITSVEGITEYHLANGLKVLLFPDPSKQTITVNVTYLVGSRQENYGETGMAHLLEHLMFKGSINHPNVSQELTAHGARANGTTNYDRTNYFETFTATDENLKWALDLESDRMVHSFIQKKDLDSEMTVVRNEYEAGENNPLRVLIERIFSTAYLSHAYGHSVIGVRSDIENVPIQRLQAYYHLYYQPDNSVLLVSGRIDPARTLALIEQRFGAIPRPTRRLPVFYTEEPTQDGVREVELRRVGDMQVIAAGYHVPAAAHPDFAALDMLTLILSQAPAGRLYKTLVQSGKAASVFGDLFGLHDPGMLVLGARLPATASVDEARSTLLSNLEQFTDSPATAEEVERARAQLLKDVERQLDASDRFGVELSEWIAAGDWRLFFLYRDRLRTATAADIQRVAVAYLKPSNRTAGVFLPSASPTRAAIPATPDVAAILKDYRGDPPREPGEAFDPSPTNIDARTVHKALPGGLKLAMLPKKTRGSIVTATMLFDFGDEQSLKGLHNVGAFCGQMLLRGTTQHTRQQLQDEFNRLKANVQVSGSAENAFARVATTREHLADVMTLLAEVLREPAFPADELEILKRNSLATLAQQRTEPQALAGTWLERHLHPYPSDDVRYTPTVDEEIARVSSVTLEQVRSFYKRFYGGSHGELGVVGDFDPSQIEALAAKLFDDWKTPSPYARVPRVFHEVTAQNETIRTPDKANAYFMAAESLELRDDDPDYPAMVLGNYLLGGGFISSRLATRVRQKEGLSYSIASGLSASAFDRAGRFSVTAICAPQNAARVETAVREELERALRGGFTADEVKAAKSGWLQTRQLGRAQDGEVSQKLASDEFLGRTLAWDASLEERVKSLTPDEIGAALRKHINPDRLSIVKGGDFAQPAASHHD
jgi:zinc protease